MTVGRLRGRMVLALVGMALCASVLPPAAWANAPVGACCLPGGSCENLDDFTCDAREGRFVSFDSTCARINCAAAPALSFAGLILVAGLLGTFGCALVLRRLRALGPPNSRS